jgi:Xaa-Pro aminopeptidase
MHLYGAELWHIANEAFPAATFIRAHDLLAQLEGIKTPQEIAAIRTACSVAAAGFDFARRDLHPGSKEMELAAQTGALFASSAASAGVDRQHAFIYCMSGPNSAKAYYAYAHSAARRINHADAVLLHCNSQLNGFWTDITRSFLMGNASAKLNDMMRVVLEARDAALARIAPGIAACEVDRAAREVIEKNGYGSAFKHPTGHGVGFGAISAAALPRLHPKSTDKLETGMVFNVEPAIYLENIGGVRQCEMVAVTSAGCDLLTPFQNRSEDLQLPKRRVA